MTHGEANETEIGAVLRWQNAQFGKQMQMRRTNATEILHTAANKHS
jgi:hypothetical protein